MKTVLELSMIPVEGRDIIFKFTVITITYIHKFLEPKFKQYYLIPHLLQLLFSVYDSITTSQLTSFELILLTEIRIKMMTVIFNIVLFEFTKKNSISEVRSETIAYCNLQVI